MSDKPKILVDFAHDRQVLTITLNAPKGNVIDRQMMQEIRMVVDGEARQPQVKLLVFKGAGSHFSFGASVPEHQKEYVKDMLSTFHDLFRALIDLSKPLTAVVRGQCLGGGLELAAFCNWIFASEDARFGQPEIQLGVFPPVASLVLPHRVGQSAADDLNLTGRSLTAQEARAIGLVYSVSADPEQALEEFVQAHILPKSAVALQFAFSTSRYLMHEQFLKHIAAVERLYVERLMETRDANEGIAAFLEKRKPVWMNE
ncbi:MAG: enoyl-CoA hydratase-related protein [candidate division KSB1 bacterium]|nr:enoyl-CoA hydratase-related protein [candidate division KSB1 bacterium]